MGQAGSVLSRTSGISVQPSMMRLAPLAMRLQQAVLRTGWTSSRGAPALIRSIAVWTRCCSSPGGSDHAHALSIEQMLVEAHSHGACRCQQAGCSGLRVFGPEHPASLLDHVQDRNAYGCAQVLQVVVRGVARDGDDAGAAAFEEMAASIRCGNGLSAP